ncbi:23S ribosomal RNA methyltransferase Erm [Actinomycetota bacterium]
MPTYRHGRHEHGQNFLTDRSTVSAITDLVAATSGPILEIGPGDGALTTPMTRLGRPITAIEIDPRLAQKLGRRLPAHASVINTDILTHRLPTSPHVVVGNLPFHQTTAILRRLLPTPGWTDAILLVQWEVARRRAGVGGSTMMTAQWAPWFEFKLHNRVSARCFTPTPGVDGGILTMHRRTRPLLAPSERRRYQGLVHQVFTGPGRGLAQVLSRNTGLDSPHTSRLWLDTHGLSPQSLPKDLPVEAWVDLFETTGTSPPRHHRRSRSARALR